MIAWYVVMSSAILLLASGFSAGDYKQDDKDQLQGHWTVVSVELSGSKQDEGEIRRLKPVMVKGSEWTAPTGDKFTFKLNPTRSPKELDLQAEMDSKVKTWRGIYKLEGNTLTFCRSQGPEGERPKEFRGGEREILIVFKRSGK
ncbi:MAG: TIGR03067 domain-containing protein [Blastocatellia bacterium]|nr:TIGR03067 domain-containing protein [Blastocatellia bacterium]